MIQIIVRANQDIYDILVQEYGSVEFYGKLIDDNNLNFSGDISQGQLLFVDKEQNANADVKDFFELGELMMHDALQREESCGGHFREEHQTSGGEAMRNDEDFAHVSAWDWNNADPVMYKEELVFENVELKTRSYK